MTIDIEINGSTEAEARYVSYAPSPCRIRNTGAAGSIEVTLRSEAVHDAGGEVVFYSAPDEPSEDALRLDLAADGSWADFWIGGKWQHLSTQDRDCELSAWVDDQKQEAVRLMVRARKNANELEAGERDRFLQAFAQLNDRGLGKFADFRAMHVDASRGEAHGGPHFLPWHRSYLLDLERELQAVDPSVSLHYWRWDEPAPSLFHRDFIGVTDSDGWVDFTPGHPLSTWVTNGDVGIRRTPHFDTETSPAAFPWQGGELSPLGQTDTLDLGDDYAAFRGMEGNPHGWAHVSFEGWISSIPTAAKDPLFFMLHSNVDRLWALWQWRFRRAEPTDPDVYVEQNRDGRRLGDTLWPWNGVTGFPRPDFAPGGPLADSPSSSAPDPTPALAQMIDYQGWIRSTARLGYGYDNVPFEYE